MGHFSWLCYINNQMVITPWFTSLKTSVRSPLRIWSVDPMVIFVVLLGLIPESSMVLFFTRYSAVPRTCKLFLVEKTQYFLKRSLWPCWDIWYIISLIVIQCYIILYHVILHCLILYSVLYHIYISYYISYYIS